MIKTRLKVAAIGVGSLWLTIFLLANLPSPFSDNEHSPAWWASMIIGIAMAFIAGLAGIFISVDGSTHLLKKIDTFFRGESE